MTKLQIRILHIAVAQLKLTDEQYRTILRNKGGVESSTKLTQAAFEDVMEVMEMSGFVDKKGPGYWASKVKARERGGDHGEQSRMAWKIHRLAAESRYNLGALCFRFSGGRADQVELLLPREQWKLIEMLKAEAQRAAEGSSLQPRASAGKDPPQGSGRRQDAGLFDSLV